MRTRQEDSIQLKKRHTHKKNATTISQQKYEIEKNVPTPIAEEKDSLLIPKKKNTL